MITLPESLRENYHITLHGEIGDMTLRIAKKIDTILIKTERGKFIMLPNEKLIFWFPAFGVTTFGRGWHIWQ